jgi:hypothetical protein
LAVDIERQAELAAEAASQAVKDAYDKAYFQALLDVATGSLDRSRSAADFVQKAAAAIGILYTGVLGVSFSVANQPLPPQGFISAIFLALAMTLATAYVAYAGKPDDVALEPLNTEASIRFQRHLRNFFHIITAAVGKRQSWLRASVLALGLGVLFLPAVFITLPSPSEPAASGTAANAPASPAWPTPPAVSSDIATALIQSVVFKAQVDEVAAQRQKARSGSPAQPNWPLWILITLVGIVLVFIDPLNQWRKGRKSASPPVSS